LVARLQMERERALDVRPSLIVSDLPLANFTIKFCGNNIICIECAKHLKKGTTALSEGVQSFNKAPKHWRSIDDGIGHQAAVFRPFQDSPECNQLGEQDKRDSFSFEPYFALPISPISPSYVHRWQYDCDGPNSLNPPGSPRMGLNPSQYCFRKLETFEHLTNLPRLSSFVDRWRISAAVYARSARSSSLKRVR